MFCNCNLTLLSTRASTKCTLLSDLYIRLHGLICMKKRENFSLCMVLIDHHSVLSQCAGRASLHHNRFRVILISFYEVFFRFSNLYSTLLSTPEMTLSNTLSWSGIKFLWCWLNAEWHMTYAEPTPHYVPLMLTQRGMIYVQLTLSQRRIMFPYADTTRIHLSVW